MVFVLVVGAIAIVFFVALIAFLIIKLFLKLISNVEKSEERVEKSIKKMAIDFSISFWKKIMILIDTMLLSRYHFWQFLYV